ncbi:ArsC/Spx/MgsR family protein [Maricaulis sp.]|jgi:arsenate reductase|uniref:arsenate reductase family protein n=1 Tax=Maricaulis sp. TaxID=1486257 RepID=UPI00261A4748|nr:ArsC/Spx/MgsR family protein [Maricaulis sp.]
MALTVYGLKNCDTCRKALKDMVDAGVVHRFVDIREDADRVRKVPAWIDAVGPQALINTRSTTWRNLSGEDRSIAEEDPAGLLIAHPTLIKRPIVEFGDKVTVGWTPAVKRSVIEGMAG